MKYALVTPARDEEAFITKTLDSVCAQTVLPERWIVVDDGSTDRTPEIVVEYTRRFPWIELVRRPPRRDRNFAAKAQAFHAGFQQLESVQFEVIGSLDADISFEPEYFEFLLGKFRECPKLGVAGTAMCEAKFHALRDSFYNENDVPGNCQLFRLGCFHDVGGYTPIRWGGIDWVAVRAARLKGWETRAFPEKLFYHHRPMGTAEGGILKARFDYGRKDYFLGNHPLWQVCRVTHQVLKWPYVVGGFALLFGYLYSFASRMDRPVTPELVRFHRQEQLQRLRQLLTRFLQTGQLRLRG